MSERDQTPGRPDPVGPDDRAPGSDDHDDRTRQMPAFGDAPGYGPAPTPEAGRYGAPDRYPAAGPDGLPEGAERGAEQAWSTPPAEQQAWSTPPAGQQAWSAPPAGQPAWGAPDSGPQSWATAGPGQYPAPAARGGWQDGPPGQTWGPAPGYGQPAPAGGAPSPPGYGAPAAQPSKRRGNGGLIALLLVAAVVLTGVGTGAYFLLRSSDDPSAQTTADRAASARSGESAGSGGSSASGGTGAAAACDRAPAATVTSAGRHAGELAVDVEFTAACTDGDLLDGEDVLVTITQDGTVVAANVFDFSRSPIELGSGETVERRLGFGQGDFLLPPEMIRAPLTATVARQADGPALPAGAAADALDLLVAQDAATLESVEGRWLPQISAKRSSLVAPSLLGSEFPGEVHWDAETILAEHLALREKYPDAALLYSGDWSTYDLDDFYVTVIADPRSSDEAVLSWCRTERLGRDDCLAKIVSDTRGPDGSTTLQRD